ncbi:putative ABC transporter ATP-binding protein YheS [Andreprevotia sp. IGB-42]|uniref:ATP-binding cassette domain-containing protein n=1 Tax=Andreprevotia sp. IGB-42 TaxID=2497473 RepID=UPI00157E5C3A|nr:ATP-binding cassette domain-containing protein [Andreprevotia sp. IGB-42]KAF0811313.1 putative ABC transporter ATP-binding protein YheS [Andreprevotia sp. IGB-42]
MPHRSPPGATRAIPAVTAMPVQPSGTTAFSSTHAPTHTPMLALRKLSLTLPDGRALLDTLNHTFTARRTGLIGPNGSGKTLLGRLLAGDIAPTSGQVLRGGRIYHVAQEPDPATYPTVAALAGVAPVLAALARIASGSLNEADYTCVAERWDCAAQLDGALAAAGLPHLHADAPTKDLSGGERQRVALLGAWLSGADFLILDEPGNHLDRGQKQRLATQIDQWPGQLLLISHDRDLLEHTDEIIALDAHGLQRYGGNYSHYAAMHSAQQQAASNALAAGQAAARRAQRALIAQRERQHRRTAHGARAARDANQSKLLIDAAHERSEHSQGRLRQLQHAAQAQLQQQLATLRQQYTPPLQRLLLPPESSIPDSSTVLQLHNLVLPHGQRAPINLILTGPARIAVTGCNGSGKSTLLRVIAGQLAASAGGVIRPAVIGWLDQHAGLQYPARTALAWLQACNPTLGDTATRMHLAQIGIDPARVLLPAAQLSGGERLKVALAAELYASPAPRLLLLDEPDNHLDLPSLQALVHMLRQYRGALLVVSHSQRFLDEIGLTGMLQIGDDLAAMPEA